MLYRRVGAVSNTHELSSSQQARQVHLCACTLIAVIPSKGWALIGEIASECGTSANYGSRNTGKMLALRF